MVTWSIVHGGIWPILFEYMTIGQVTQGLIGTWSIVFGGIWPILFEKLTVDQVTPCPILTIVHGGIWPILF